MFRQSCNRCGKFTVKNANYCWYCGVQIGKGGKFETALAIDDDYDYAPQPKRAATNARDNWQVLIARSGVAFAASGLGLWMFGISTPFGWAAAPAALVAMAPPIIEAFADYSKAKPLPEPEPKNSVLRIEEVEQTQYGPKIAIVEADNDKLSMDDLRCVADLTFPHPHGQGKSFSRRKCGDVGLSQGKYDLLKDFFIAGRYAQYRNGKPTNGLVFTARGKKLLYNVYRTTLPQGSG